MKYHAVRTNAPCALAVPRHDSPKSTLLNLLSFFLYIADEIAASMHIATGASQLQSAASVRIRTCKYGRNPQYSTQQRNPSSSNLVSI